MICLRLGKMRRVKFCAVTHFVMSARMCVINSSSFTESEVNFDIIYKNGLRQNFCTDEQHMLARFIRYNFFGTLIPKEKVIARSQGLKSAIVIDSNRKVIKSK